MMVGGYGLVNARVGFRWAQGWDVFIWSRNLLDTNYYELLTAQPGNSGLIVGLPGDPRTVGLTFRLAIGGRPIGRRRRDRCDHKRCADARRHTGAGSGQARAG